MAAANRSSAALRSAAHRRQFKGTTTCSRFQTQVGEKKTAGELPRIVVRNKRTRKSSEVNDEGLAAR